MKLYIGPSLVLACGLIAGVAMTAPKPATGPTAPEAASAYMAAPAARAIQLLPPPPRAAEPTASSDEPFAARLSAVAAAHYLDTIAVNWTAQRKCGTCHTNYAYMMARPLLNVGSGSDERDVRAFFDQRIHMRTSRPALPHTIILASMLAINDAAHGDGLRPATREALDQAWELQGDDGAWAYPEIFYSPPLGDPAYGAAMMALATGIAPDHYAATPAARVGMARLRIWLGRHPPQSLHQRIILLWAAQKTHGIMTAAEAASTIDDLRRLQRPDGGWNLPSLGQWNRRDGSPNDPNAPSDGYATGLISFVLQQTGLTVRDKAVAAGIDWLSRNQRASGRWYTHSINTDDKGNLISNIGTAYAVMALRAAGQLKS